MTINRLDLQTLLSTSAHASVQLGDGSQRCLLETTEASLQKDSDKLSVPQDRDVLRTTLFRLAEISGDPHEFLQHIEATLDTHEIDTTEQKLRLLQCLADVRRWFSET